MHWFYLCFCLLCHPGHYTSGMVKGLIFCGCASGDSSTGSLGSLMLVTLPLVCREGLVVAVLVTPPLDSRGSLASRLLAGDTSVGELASASAGDSCSLESELEDDGDS